MLSCLVFGHGFISSHLEKRLKRAGHQVTVVSLKEKTTEGIDYLLENDYDYYFYLSAYGNHYTQRDLEETYQANLFKFYYLCSKLVGRPTKGIVYVSTSSVGLPTQTMYSATKAASEKLARGFADTYELPVISIRPSSVYGPGEADFRFIPTVIRSILTGETLNLDEKPRHDWIVVEDLITGIVILSRHAKTHKGRVFELGTGSDVSNKEVVHRLEQIMEKKATINLVTNTRNYDMPFWYANTEAANKLGWSAKTDLMAGLIRTVSYYRGVYASENT